MSGWRIADDEQRTARVTRLGGQPSWHGEPRWPYRSGEALPFLGQVVLPTGETVLVFMSLAEDAESWVPERGANAAIVEPGGELPSWVQARAEATGPTALPDLVLVGDGPVELGAAPVWLQFDETPADAPVLVCQLDSFPDPEGYIAFGDGGVAYLFVSEDRRIARFLWQS